MKHLYLNWCLIKVTIKQFQNSIVNSNWTEKVQINFKSNREVSFKYNFLQENWKKITNMSKNYKML